MPEPLRIQDMELMEILELAAPEGGGWLIGCDCDQGWYGGVFDDPLRPNEYGDGDAMGSLRPVRIIVDVDPGVNPKELVNIPAGYGVRLTYDNEKTKIVYLPHITGDDLVEGGAGWWLPMYVSEDGSTYWDEALTQLAHKSPIFCYVEASVILRQHIGLEASIILKQWLDLLASATFRHSGSDEVEATCVINQLLPEIPVGLTTLDMKKGDSVLLDWDENVESNVLYYKIYKRENAEWILVGQTEKPPYQVGGLLKDTEYRFAVTAVAVKSVEGFLPNVVYNNNDQIVRSIVEEIVEIEEV